MVINKVYESKKAKAKSEGISFFEWYLILEYLDKKFNFGYVGVEKYFNYRKHYDNNNTPEETLNVVFDYFAFTEDWEQILEGRGITVDTLDNVFFIRSPRA